MKSFYKITGFVVFICLIHQFGYSQIVVKKRSATPIPKGVKIPELEFEEIINGPKEITPALLEGKVVVIEFWATWCAPCVKNFPKLNNLADEYKNNDVVIISVTDEPATVVKPFLERRPLNTWIVSDTDRSVIDAFGVSRFPTTAVVNADGKLHEYISVNDLNTAYIDALLVPSVKSQPQASFVIKEKAVIRSEGKPSSGNNSVFSVLVEEDTISTGESGMMGKGLGMVNKSGWQIQGVLADTYGVSEGLVKGPKEILEKRVKVEVRLPSGKEEMVDELVNEALFKQFGFTAELQKSNEKLMELSAPKGLSKNLKLPESTRGRFSADDGVIIGRNFKLSGLIRNIESVLGISIYNNTQLNEKYDYDLFWDHNKPDTIIKALKDQLGLELKERTLEVEVVMVQSKVAG